MYIDIVVSGDSMALTQQQNNLLFRIKSRVTTNVYKILDQPF